MNLRSNWRELVALFLIFLISFFSWKTLLLPGFFSMHDYQHVVRLSELDRALSFGQFPVRWIENLGFGYGYPLFNFYPPLAYYLGEIFHLAINTNLIDSLKMVWFFALLGSAISMYFLAKQFFGKVGGILSACFYLYAPYHAIDAYVRGSLAELFSFVWLPLILLFSYQAILKKSWTKLFLTGVLLSILMLSHNLIFLPFVGFLFLWVLGTSLANGKDRISFGITTISISLIMAFGLTAYFWIPSLAEKQFTLVDQLLIKNLASYQIHFVCPSQLWNSPWGFGGSTNGCIDGMSFKLGKMHILGVGISFVVLAFLIYKKAFLKAKEIGLMLVLFLVSIFMTLEISKPVWQILNPLWYLQFPWRFLEFSALFSSLLIGSIFWVIKNNYVKIFIAFCLVSLVLYSSAKLFTPKTSLLWVNDSNQTTDYESKWFVSSSSFEYMYKDTATKNSDIGTVVVDISKNEIAKEKVKIMSGDFVISKSQFAPDKFIVYGSGSKKSILRFSINYFPGWKAWINNKEVQIKTNNKLALIEIAVPAGTNIVRGQFTNTIPRTLGNIISVVFIFLTITIFYGIRRSKIKNN